LVHQRDTLDHTPLYYAARQGHQSIVQKLVKVGALLNGSDSALGYAELAMRRAEMAQNDTAFNIWRLAAGNSKEPT